jgi:two-component system sensor histidine kinase RegB
MTSPASQYTAPFANLRRLFWLRNVVIVFLFSTALLLRHLDIPLQIAPIVAAVGSMLLLNGVTWLRMRHRSTVSEHELLAQLIGDIATLTGLFYFTGGYSNPFVWMYLLPLSVAAVALPALYVWLLTALAVSCYSLLVFFHVPLSHLHVHYREGIGLDIHLVGMWLGFVVCAGLIALFVSRISQNLREYDRLIAETREKALESERMLALGALAAAAAHELGTPLSTMAVVAGELADEVADQPNLASSLALIRTQIGRCKEILTSITASAGQVRAEGNHGQAVDAFLENTLARWQDMHPETDLDWKLSGAIPAPRIAVDRTIAQALVNLLDNAADASPERIELAACWDTEALHLTIRDHGPGITAEIAEKTGTPFFTTKESKGMGLGLYLARIIFGRFGGTVSLDNHPGGGSLATVHLPLKALMATPPA